MSYTAGELFDYTLLASGGVHHMSATTTGEKGSYVPGYYKIRIRAIYCVVLNSVIAATNPVIGFRTEDPAGGGTATTDQFGSVTLASGSAQLGKVYYNELSTPEVVSPGEAVVCHVTTAATTAGVKIRAGVLAEPVWEEPGNNTDMVSVSS